MKNKLKLLDIKYKIKLKGDIYSIYINYVAFSKIKLKSGPIRNDFEKSFKILNTELLMNLPSYIRRYLTSNIYSLPFHNIDSKYVLAHLGDEIAEILDMKVDKEIRKNIKKNKYIYGDSLKELEKNYFFKTGFRINIDVDKNSYEFISNNEEIIIKFIKNTLSVLNKELLDTFYYIENRYISFYFISTIDRKKIKKDKKKVQEIFDWNYYRLEENLFK